MINFKKIAGKVAACLTAVVLLTSGCDGGIPIVSEIGETAGYSDPQMMILITTEKNRYRDVYGAEIWDVVVDDSGETFQAYLLDKVHSFLTELKTINNLADEHEVELSGQEREQLRQLSREYFGGLTEEDIAYMGITEDDVYHMYEQYHRANKLVSELTKDVNLEISDNEAKVISVQEIRVDSEEAARSVYEQVTAEGADFAAIARTASGDSVIDKQIGRGERTTEYEDVVFQMLTDEIAGPIQEGDQDYVIVKCISDYDEAATLERKQRLSQQRKNQAFRQIYDTYASDHKVEIQSSIWEELSFTADDRSVTTNFFELYQQQMSY